MGLYYFFLLLQTLAALKSCEYNFNSIPQHEEFIVTFIISEWASPVLVTVKPDNGLA